MESSSRATAEILPGEIIHKILSFLNFKEAAQLGIISKKWLQASLNHPNLEFKLCSSSQVEKWDKIFEKYRDENIPIERFVLSNLSGSRAVFLWIDKWLDIALQNGVKYLRCKNPIYSPYPFPIFKLENSVRELVLKCCDLMQYRSLATSHVTNNWYPLTSLRLSRVTLDDNMLRTFLTCCPLIAEVVLKYCTGLEKIELRGLKKIKSFSIKLYRDDRIKIKIQAPTLEHLYYSSYSNLEELDIIEYQNLKLLEISCGEICGREEFIEQLISGSQFLESLILVCEGEGSLNICRSRSLKNLKLKNCNVIGEIDAPNLVLLKYEWCCRFPVKFAEVSSQLKHLQITLGYRYTLDAMWFCELKKFLSNSTSWPHVSLRIFDCDKINREDFRSHHRVATPLVDVLDVDIMSLGKFPTFVDALIWSCHPRRLNLSSTVRMINCSINRLMHMKNSSHSSSHESEPWLCQLKDVKVYNIQDNTPVQPRSGLLAERKFEETRKVYFLLDW